MALNPIQLPAPYPQIDSGQWDAYQILQNFEFLAGQMTVMRQSHLVPSGSLVMFRAGTTCPAGYTKVSSPGLAGRYLRINLTTGGGTGGSATSVVTSSGSHTHPVGIPTSTRTVTSTAVGTVVTVPTSTHLHVLTAAGTHTHTAVIAPLYLDVILCQKT